MTLSGLVPSGVYSVFWQTVGPLSGNLLAADQLYFVVVYHLDSTTYYPLPTRAEYLTQGGECRSSLGYDAMRHLVVAQKF